MDQTYSIYNILDYYNFKTKQQKDALENFMQQASILGFNQSIQDKFPVRTKYKEFVRDVLEFVTLVQKYFTIRTGAQERWNVSPPSWALQNQQENFQLLKILGMTDEIGSGYSKSNALCVLGAAKPRIEIRMKFAKSIIDDDVKPDNFVLIAGERYVTLGVDGTEEELKNIAKHQNISFNKLTETYLMKEISQQLAIYNEVPTYIIDTPKGGLLRPTTQTTILEFVEWLEKHQEVRNVTFISNQPHIMYQEAVIKEVFETQKVQIDIEVIGAGISFEKDKIYPIIGELGAYIWAKTPLVLLELDQIIDDVILIDEFKDLYKKQPLFYQSLAGILYGNDEDL